MGNPIFPPVNSHTGTSGVGGTDLAFSPQSPSSGGVVLLIFASWVTAGGGNQSGPVAPGKGLSAVLLSGELVWLYISSSGGE